jgi:hypothetical protein
MTHTTEGVAHLEITPHYSTSRNGVQREERINMKKFITSSRQIVPAAPKQDSRGVGRFNFKSAAFRCALVSLLLFIGIGAAQAQPDPLTITKDGNVGIGTTSPANKLSVAGNTDVSGNVGVGTTTPANKLSVVGNADFSGNVGVGTVTPANKLSVTGNADFSGNVGIGTTNPAGKLQVAGGATPALRLDANAGVAALNIGGTGQLVVDSPGAGGGRFFLDDSGNVFIGGASIARAKVQIDGFVNSALGGPSGYLSAFPYTIVGNAGLPIQLITPNDPMNPPRYMVSLFASNDILASGFRAFSDARIKRIEGRSAAAHDLATLLSIEVTDYSYIDTISKGTGAYKKVTGQQLEKVFPQAVFKMTDVVPDIYQKAVMKDGWVMLATNLKKGERVRLIGEMHEGIHEVLEIAEGKFRTAFVADGGDVFVYGREVNDARSVDYEAISMLNVSATQQIKKEKDEEVKALQEENAALRSQLAEQEKRLAAIEVLLLSVEKPAAGTASLKKVE